MLLPNMLRMSWSIAARLAVIFFVLDVCQCQTSAANLTLAEKVPAVALNTSFASAIDLAAEQNSPNVERSAKDKALGQSEAKKSAYVQLCRNGHVGPSCFVLPAPADKIVDVPWRWNHNIYSIEVISDTSDDYFCRFYKGATRGSTSRYFDVDNNGFTRFDRSTTEKTAVEERIRYFTCHTSIPDKLVKPMYWHWPRDESRLCHRLNAMWLDFEMSDDMGSGTYDVISLIFRSPGQDFQNAGTRGVLIETSPSAGAKFSRRIDLREVFGLNTIGLDQISSVELFSKRINSMFGGDEWRVKGFTLMARCAGTDVIVSLDKFSNLQKSLRAGVLPTRRGDSRFGVSVWSSGVSPENWISRPGCSHFRHLEAEVQIGNRFWAGTLNELLIRVGYAEAVVAKEPERGRTYVVPLNIRRIYRRRDVPPLMLWGLSVWTRGPHCDKAYIEGITLRAECADTGKKQVLHRDVEHWFGRDEFYKTEINISDWKTE